MSPVRRNSSIGTIAQPAMRLRAPPIVPYTARLESVARNQPSTCIHKSKLHAMFDLLPVLMMLPFTLHPVSPANETPPFPVVLGVVNAIAKVRVHYDGAQQLGPMRYLQVRGVLCCTYDSVVLLHQTVAVFASKEEMSWMRSVGHECLII